MAWQFCIYLPSKLSQTFRYKPLNSLRTSLSIRDSLQNMLLLSCSSHMQKVNKGIHPDTDFWVKFYAPPEVMQNYYWTYLI